PGTVTPIPCNTTVASGYMWFQDSAQTQPICPPSAVTSTGTNNITGTCTFAFQTGQTGSHTITAYYCPGFPTTQASGFYIIYTCSQAGYTTGNYTQTVQNT